MSTRRLIPVWYVPLVFTLLIGLALLGALVGALADGPVAPAMTTAAVASVGGLVAACPALLGRRRRIELAPDEDGVVVLRSPLAITVGVLTAWAAVLVLAVLIVRMAITDFSQIESPGGALLAVVGAIGTLPDLVRLATGRLYRWRLELGPDELTYRGFRTSRTIPWKRVTRVETQRRSPAGIRVESRDGDVVVPIVAFRIDPDQLVEEIRTRSRSRQR